MKNHITAKHLNFSILMIAIIFGVSTHLNAQSITGNIYVPETGKTWNDPGLAGQDLSFYHRMQFDIPFLQMIEFKMRREGERRIRTKTTSTNFTPSPRVITLEEMVPDDASETQKQKIIANNRNNLILFNKQLKKVGFTPNDLADAKAVAFSLAFYALKGEDPGLKRIKWLRGKYKNSMLKDTYFQGTPDYMRQQQYEKIAVASILAYGARKKSEEANLSEEMQTVYTRKAESTARPIFSGIWTDPPDSIVLTAEGFTDQGKLGVENSSKQGMENSSGGATTFLFSKYSRVIGNTFRKNQGTFENSEEKWSGILNKFNKYVKKIGFNANDVADGQAASFVALYEFTSGKTLNAKQIADVRKEFRIIILGDEELYRMSDLEKQEAYENTGISAFTFLDDYESTLELRRRNPDFNSQKDTDSMVEHLQSMAMYYLDTLLEGKYDEYLMTDDGFRKM